MNVMTYQMAVSRDPGENLSMIEDAVTEATRQNARLLLLPEGIISRDPDDPDATAAAAQPLDGPFVTRLLELSKSGVAIAGTVHVPSKNGKVSNIAIACDGGDLVHTYTKLHLYDAFSDLESDHVEPGEELPGTFTLDGFTFGILTCYDIRFPEPARVLASAGADALLLPAAWVRGPLKEQHWRTLITARALENTMYVLGCGECSRRNCGESLSVDPLGITIAAAAESPARFNTTLDHNRINHARESLPVLKNRRFADPQLKPLQS